MGAPCSTRRAEGPKQGGVKRPPLRGRTVYCPAPIAVRFPGTHKPMTSYDVIPMTLGNMRLLGVRSLVVSCEVCRHEAILSAEPWPDGVPVPAFGPRMVCSSCGITGADAQPNWKERSRRWGLNGRRPAPHSVINQSKRGLPFNPRPEVGEPIP
jgi:hypothetical protein